MKWRNTLDSLVHPPRQSDANSDTPFALNTINASIILACLFPGNLHWNVAIDAQVLTSTAQTVWATWPLSHCSGTRPFLAAAVSDMNPHCVSSGNSGPHHICQAFFLEMWVTSAGDGTCFQYQYFACLINHWPQIAIRKLVLDFLQPHFILSQEISPS